jgi:hypothetical protein
MAVDWSSVSVQIANAVSGVVGPAWQNAAAGASTQFAALIAAGQQIEQNQNTLAQAEYNSLKLMQQRALEGVLLTYQGIAIDIAEEAAAAAWNVLVSALSSAYPALGIVL